MKLAELMNDDTCQILLAIIVGIVICYFIFGSCSSGSCNRDGFSVGGQACEQVGSLAQSGVRCDSLNNNRQGCQDNQACRWVSSAEMMVNTPRQYCDQFIMDMDATMESTCEYEGENEAGIREDCCFGVTPGQDGGIMLMNDANSNYLACSDPSNIDLKTDLNEFQTVCQREYPGGDTRVASGTDAAAANSPPAPPPAATPAVKYSYILQDMAHAIISLSGPGFDAGEFDIMIDGDGNYEATYANFNNMKNISERQGIYFQLLMNDHTTDPEKDSKGYTDQYNSIAFARSEDNPLNIITSDDAEIEYYITETGISATGTPPAEYNYRDAVVSLRLGDLFGTYAIAPRQVKEDSYCKRNSMTIATNVEKIDPLLKMKSRFFLNRAGYAYCKTPYFPDICRSARDPPPTRPHNCDFFIANENLSPDKDAIADITEISASNNRVANQLLKISTDPDKGSEDTADIEYLVLNYNNNRNRLEPNGIRSPFELIMNDASFSLDLDQYTNDPLTKLIHINGNNIDIRSRINFHRATGAVTDRGRGGGRQTTTFQLPPNSNNYTLIKAYGMSQNRSGDIYLADATDDPVNDYVNNYYTNLLQIQYLITKIIIGTDRYLGRNLNIYNKNVQVIEHAERVMTERPNLPSTFNYIDNNQCAVQGRDWLLLVYIQKPSTGSLAECDDSVNSITSDLGAARRGANTPGLLCTLPPPAPPPPPPPPPAPPRCVGTEMGTFCEDSQATKDCWPHCKAPVDNPYDSQHDAQYRCENKYDSATSRQCVYGWANNYRRGSDGYGCHSGNICTLP